MNPDGSLRPGATGSFDARQFRMGTAPDGRPVFRPAGTKGAGDERWASGFGLANGTDGTVYAVVQSGTDMYIGGDFTTVGNVAANYVAKWNGTAWSPLGTGVGNGLNGVVSALVVAGNGDVYAGGSFTLAGAVAVSRVAKWNGTAWSSLGNGAGNGLNNYVQALAVASNGDVYAGGYFTQAGGVAASGVAKWNGATWSPLGTGVVSSTGANGIVNALVVTGNGDVYAGGDFTLAGGATANNVAKWNGSAWSSLGTGVSGRVFALAVAGNGDVYAGGEFFTAGSLAVNAVAKWNGTAWSTLDVGTNGFVNALAVAGNGDVYAGGYFTQAGGAAANNVAKWNGTSWSALGTGLTVGVYGSVYALAVAGNGDVYAGSNFTLAGGVTANSIAKWNGSAWSSLGTGTGTGVYGNIYAVAVAGNGDVYAGGKFIQAGGAAANNVAKWNGSVWAPLGTGTNSTVSALALSPNSKLYAGGSFSAVGDISKVMAHFGIYDPNAPLATATSQKAAPAALFPNPAHGTATLRLPAGAPRLPLTLTDALGRVVRRYPAPATAEAALDLRGLPAGVYVVRCGEYAQRLVVE
ncbi:T9SS type A sorting domain-containing protein [Hymenobacter rubidus]|uniref:T9SS type A sorting domain-containing protein n=1 Tax=Hymenobacter rubidus TaxID=1441626 RepID=UPI00191F7992|nr:T9SS type A sorting domain-containing protein [Hymenobacter rubidus]